MVIRAFEGEGIEKSWRPLEQIAPILPKAVIAAEDNGFCSHFGVDSPALLSQIRLSLRGQTTRGASTLSMQLAKNLFLWPGRSFLRKGLELGLTPYLELVLGKRRIMELYLNMVEFGPGLYGAEAASRAFFKKSADALTITEASLLAAVLPNPRRFSAARPSPYINGRAALYRQRIVDLGPARFSCVGVGEASGPHE